MFSSAEPTFSQSGEDRILCALFSNFSNRSRLHYFDIGAALPVNHNNSYLAYAMGGNGVLVDADPSYAIEYRAMRPRDAYLSAAIVPERLVANGTVAFHIMHDPGWSTASDEHLAIAAHLGKGVAKSTITVPCLTINELLARYDFGQELDFISLDIEGLDQEVLKELDTERFDPKAVVAENSGGLPIHKEIMEGKGYAMYAFTFINSVYIRRSHFVL
jgi:FkbM family methyltransferase